MSLALLRISPGSKPTFILAFFDIIFELLVARCCIKAALYVFFLTLDMLVFTYQLFILVCLVSNIEDAKEASDNGSNNSSRNSCYGPKVRIW
ncbi:MAG TPA: hypothetical protein VHZ51_01660 [Ktedonobacteraceae bacterium]|nr:hypothetical protein [Ktedonobacteraceae bacterium]